jgi:hypothetical protein
MPKDKGGRLLLKDGLEVYPQISQIKRFSPGIAALLRAPNLACLTLKATASLWRRVGVGAHLERIRVSLRLAINAGGIMPPKSTWFEPKLREAYFAT